MNQSERRGTQLSPPRVLALAFLAAIGVGALLLSAPWAQAEGARAPFLTALFTATSAVCVTGLVVVDTGTYWSAAGQTVILALIQIGGIGVMTVSTMVGLAAGRRVGLRERLILREQLGGVPMAGATHLARSVVALTLGFQALGFLLMSARLATHYPLGRAGYLGLFHSISAFNNAGFDLFTVSLEGFRADLFMNLVTTGLILTGGLGFIVLMDFYSWIKWRSPLTVHTRIVLTVSLGLLLLGMIAVLAAEQSNPATLAGRPLGERLLASWFHSVTPRTAGFNTLPTGDLAPSTQFVTVALMFIGGSPGSTAGGVKTTAFAVLILALASGLTGRQDLESHNRRLSWQVVNRALAIVLLAGLWIFVTTLLLLVTEGADFLMTLFEVVSAFATVGLSMGLTGHLSPVGQTAIIVTMFLGRVGPLTLAAAIAFRQRRQTNIRKPIDKVILG